MATASAAAADGLGCRCGAGIGWEWGLDWGGRLLFVFIHGSLEVVVWGLMWYLRMASFQIQVSVLACSEASPAILFGMDSEDDVHGILRSSIR